MKNPTPSTPPSDEAATEASTKAFQGMLALFGAFVDELPAEKARSLAAAIDKGALVTFAGVLPVGVGCPDVTLALVLPDGRSIALASLNVSAMH
jgi:hypothetical protein